jgi:enoyl-CoA hydratase/carnithine racemase
VENDFFKDRNERVGGFVAPVALEEYAARHSEHLMLTRESGIVEMRPHTGGEPAVYSRGMLNCWGQALADIAHDPDNEVLILTGTGSHWIAGVDRRSFAQPLSAWPADELYEQYLGAKRAAHLVYTGSALDAQGALGFGAVSEVLPQEQLIRRAREIAGQIMSRPRIARRLTHAVLARQWQLRVVEELRSSYAQQILASSR